MPILTVSCAWQLSSTVRRLGEVHDHLTAVHLVPGFIFQGERIPLVNPQRGIFKPRQMRFLLSIKTVFPRRGGRIWYDDQREVHRQIFEGDDAIDYAFMGENPDAADNRWLREAFESQVPVIYFLGIAPGRYQAILPAFVSGWDASALKARVAFGVPDQESLAPPANALERRYALRAVKQRLHQASFREAVIPAAPVDDGRLVYSAPSDAAHVRVRTSIPSHIKPGPGFREFIDELAQNPEQHHVLKPGLAFDPEIVFYIDYNADADGWAHAMQLHPDGSGDYICHKPAQLDHGVRWISRTPDQDCLGIVLPATAEPEGYSAEQAKGNIKTLGAGDEWFAELWMGYLPLEQAADMEKTINTLR